MDITQFNASSVPTAITAVQEEQNPPTQFSPAQQLFFRDLHNMLMKESSKGCVKWLDGLNGFLILDKDKFLEDTMTRYFGDAKYASFTRRLKRWGFHRISKGPNSGGYYHDTFHRNMSFEDYDDLESDISCSESSQILPPKKRMAWSPPIQADSIVRHSNDVNVMPELMREINRNKRFENFDYAETPAAKRAKFGNEFYGNSINAGFASMPGNSGNNGFASMPHPDYQMFRNSMRQDHLKYLQTLKRQVFMENHQCALNSMAPSQHRASVPNEIFKREMDLRRMQQALACQQNSNQMYNHQGSLNGLNPAMSRGVSAAACFNDRDRSEEDAVRALGALKGTNGYSDMHSSQQGCDQFQGVRSIKKKEARNYPADSTVPIPGVSEMMLPESPFNRAA